jgi:hypothetical protein
MDPEAKSGVEKGVEDVRAGVVDPPDQLVRDPRQTWRRFVGAGFEGGGDLVASNSDEWASGKAGEGEEILNLRAVLDQRDVLNMGAKVPFRW